MADAAFDSRLRSAAAQWLTERSQIHQELVTRDELEEFVFEGARIPLIDRQRGIRKPAILDAALSIKTTFTKPGQPPPYEDREGPDGLLRYKYRGSDPDHPENVALRKAHEWNLPLFWFVGIAPGVFLPRYPVWLVGDERKDLQFVVALDEAQRMIQPRSVIDEERRRYVERLTKLRLHQPVFRARVLKAYATQCAICQLRHRSLLDAAHIIPDGLPQGEPVVPNGLALCKIHHAAFDENILGIRPDHVVEVRPDIRKEVDGPMLRHGIQDMHGRRIGLPSERSARPDRDRLEVRYETFRSAA
ncbi:HNH endonuclease [Micromonospora mirobrigensis]|uniref:Putative restriction endonuclease n=1 Tax=Micromonospora mirobrigensis TaxID=262898 RepID=A0A1C4UDR5_9ACTN|nr:HNH endonuclease [Micromonospora mirobrigensis]SCE69825.1 putative restriction endonuclease [Micromonospora mirobrigensis]